MRPTEHHSKSDSSWFLLSSASDQCAAALAQVNYEYAFYWYFAQVAPPPPPPPLPSVLVHHLCMRSSAPAAVCPRYMEEFWCTVLLRLLVRHTHTPFCLASDTGCMCAPQQCLVCMQDGTITFEIKLTGELSTSLLSPGEGASPRWGTLVAPRVNAQVPPPLNLLAAEECNGTGPPTHLPSLRRSGP